MTREDIEDALRGGQRIELIASAKREGSRVIVRVRANSSRAHSS